MIQIDKVNEVKKRLLKLQKIQKMIKEKRREIERLYDEIRILQNGTGELLGSPKIFPIQYFDKVDIKEIITFSEELIHVKGMAELSRKHGLSLSTTWRWIKAFDLFPIFEENKYLMRKYGMTYKTKYY